MQRDAQVERADDAHDVGREREVEAHEPLEALDKNRRIVFAARVVAARRGRGKADSRGVEVERLQPRGRRREQRARELAERLGAIGEEEEVRVVMQHPDMPGAELAVLHRRRMACGLDARARNVKDRQPETQVHEKGAELLQREAEGAPVKGRAPMKKAPEPCERHFERLEAPALVVSAAAVGPLQRLDRALVELKEDEVAARARERRNVVAKGRRTLAARQPRVERAWSKRRRRGGQCGDRLRSRRAAAIVDAAAVRLVRCAIRGRRIAALSSLVSRRLKHLRRARSRRKYPALERPRLAVHRLPRARGRVLAVDMLRAIAIEVRHLELRIHARSHHLHVHDAQRRETARELLEHLAHARVVKDAQRIVERRHVGEQVVPEHLFARQREQRNRWDVRHHLADGRVHEARGVDERAIAVAAERLGQLAHARARLVAVVREKLNRHGGALVCQVLRAAHESRDGAARARELLAAHHEDARAGTLRARCELARDSRGRADSENCGGEARTHW